MRVSKPILVRLDGTPDPVPGTALGHNIREERSTLRPSHTHERPRALGRPGSFVFVGGAALKGAEWC